MYAIRSYYEPPAGSAALTYRVRHWRQYGPRYFPLPHPSPRNTLWLRRNRITSYNVCYTKLLRVFFLRQAGSFEMYAFETSKVSVLNKEEIEEALSSQNGHLMVGFNRRFAPHTVTLIV